MRVVVGADREVRTAYFTSASGEADMALAENAGASRLDVDFDDEEDVLYVSLGAPTPSHAEELPKGILLRWADADGRPSGVTAIDFRSNWAEDRRSFYSLVAKHLSVPVAAVEQAVESAV
ncbi:MAG TPA: hypothetical protein VE993_01960 [Stellaceae bacterium]|nr:hypothetical protein [Stellaceae bacterium]